MNEKVRLLIIEDDIDITKIFLDLSKVEPNLELQTAVFLSEGLAIFNQSEVDAVMVDLKLPDSEGLETLQATLLACPDVPVMVFSGALDESLRNQAMVMGAHAFLYKDNVTNDEALRGLIRAAIRKQESARAKNENYEKRLRLLEFEKSLRDMATRHIREMSELYHKFDVTADRMEKRLIALKK